MPASCRYAPSIRTSAELTADFFPTVKAALPHESADSEEDREGLGCHLGQGQTQPNEPEAAEKCLDEYVNIYFVRRFPLNNEINNKHRQHCESSS